MGKVFNKPALTVDQHLELWKNRGLLIPDVARAKHYLEYVGYYRLSGYALDFQLDDQHHFKLGSSFEDIIQLYVFDRRLRLLLMDAIERIEISVRSVLVNTLSLKYGAYWYANEEVFRLGFDLKKYLSNLKNEAKISHHNSIKRQQFIESYITKYSLPEMPPSWMIFETVSFGAVSVALKNLTPQMAKAVSSRFGLPYKIFISWVESVSYIRNLCAHHSRLWGRKFTKKPRMMNRYSQHLKDNDQLYAQLFVVNVLMQVISDETEWHLRVRKLVNQSTGVPHNFRQLLDNDFWSNAMPLLQLKSSL